MSLAVQLPTQPLTVLVIVSVHVVLPVPAVYVIGFTLFALVIIHVGLLEVHTKVTGFGLVIVALSELPVELQVGALVGKLIVQVGVFVFWFTITSAKQLSFALSGL